MTEYRNFQPQETSRVRENVEWTIRYSYNDTDKVHPRILLIGDSICNGYQNQVRAKLAEHANVSFWASSKCVTDPQYFRELDLILDANCYAFISFNNGLHSLSTKQDEWETACTGAVRFIQAKCPDAKLALTLCTPLNDPVRDAVVHRLNGFLRTLAEETAIPMIDLYAAMEGFDLDEAMSDVYHWRAAGVERQAEVICAHIAQRIDLAGGNVQAATETGPEGALK